MWRPALVRFPRDTRDRGARAALSFFGTTFPRFLSLEKGSTLAAWVILPPGSGTISSWFAAMLSTLEAPTVVIPKTNGPLSISVSEFPCRPEADS